MENFTPAIHTLLNEKLELYRQLNTMLIKERDAIVNIDVDALWKSSVQKKEIAGKVEKLREKILCHLEENYGFCDMDIHSFSISYLIRTLPAPVEKKTRLRKIKLAIENEKNQLAQSALENKKYVTEYMAVIDDIMAVAVDNSSRAQYTHAGAVPNSRTPRCLIHAEV